MISSRYGTRVPRSTTHTTDVQSGRFVPLNIPSSDASSPSTAKSNFHHGAAVAQNTEAIANIQNDIVSGWCRFKAFFPIMKNAARQAAAPRPAATPIRSRPVSVQTLATSASPPMPSAIASQLLGSAGCRRTNWE